MRRSSLLAFVILIGCGGPAAREPAPPVDSWSLAAGEGTAPQPRAISAAETALEACLAPIEPSVFSKPDGRPLPIHKSVAPRNLPRLPAVDPCEDQRSSVECAYRDARVHFEKHRFDLAAKGFRKIALDTEVTDLGLFAAQLELESLNMIGTFAEPSRPLCFDAMASDTDTLIDRYCRKPVPVDREDACITFFQIARDVRRVRAERLVTVADSGHSNEPARLYEQAGDEYRALFDEACPPNVEAGSPLSSGARCDELLFNAHRAYRAADARVKAEAAYRTFFDPRSGLAGSELAKRLAAKPE